MVKKLTMLIGLLLAGLEIQTLELVKSNTQEAIIKAINNLQLLEAISLIDSADKSSYSKQELLKVAQDLVKKREQATKTVLHSRSDLVGLAKGLILGYAGYQLIKVGKFAGMLNESLQKPVHEFGGLSATGGEDTLKLIFGIDQKQGLLGWIGVATGGKVKFTNNAKYFEQRDRMYASFHTLSAAAPKALSAAHIGLNIAGAAVIGVGAYTVINSLRTKSAKEKLAQARAIVSYIQKIA